MDMVVQYAGHVHTAPRHTISAAITTRRAELIISTDISQFLITVSILGVI
jgi:hypothetical protein